MTRSPVVLAGMLALVLAGTVLIVYGVTHHARPRAAPLPPGALSPVTNPTAASTISASAPTGTAPRAHPSATPGAPSLAGLPASSIRIPRLGVTGLIGEAVVVDGVLTPPRVPTEVGAWAGSASLDDDTGEVTLAGHVDWAGMAPFTFGRLALLRPGDLVYTSGPTGRQQAWRVRSVTPRPKSEPIDQRAFAGPGGPRRLALITCGGAFDAEQRSYVDNVYVYADPA